MYMYTHTFLFNEIPKRKIMKLEGRRKNLLEMCGRYPTKKTGAAKEMTYSEYMQVRKM